MSVHTFFVASACVRPVGQTGGPALRVVLDLSTQHQQDEAALSFLGQMGEPAFDAFMTKHFSGYLDAVRNDLRVALTKAIVHLHPDCADFAECERVLTELEA